MIPNMTSDHWMVGSDHEAITPNATPDSVASSRGIPIPISPLLNGGRVDLYVHLVMSNSQPELGGPSAVSASSIVIDGTLQEEIGREVQLRGQLTSRKADLQPLDTVLIRSKYTTPPYTPSGSHAESATGYLGEVTPVESDISNPRRQAQIFTGKAHDTGARAPQGTEPFGRIGASRRKTRKAPIEYSIESQAKARKDCADRKRQIRTDTPFTMHTSRLSTPRMTRADSPAHETRSRHNHSPCREARYAPNRHNGNNQSCSVDRPSMRSLSPGTVHGAASERGRSRSLKSLGEDHKQISSYPGRAISVTRSNRSRSQSYGAISGIESRRESYSRSQSRDMTSNRMEPRYGYVPPRLNTPPRFQWDQPAFPVNATDNESLVAVPVTYAEGQGSLASTLDVPSTAQKKASTSTTSQPEAEVPITNLPLAHQLGNMRSEKDGRQIKRRLQDRIDGGQTVRNPRCPYSHKGVNNQHAKSHPHPGYTNDEWQVVMGYVRRYGYAPPHLTKEGCVYHPDFKPPESSQPRSHPQNPFSVLPAAQGPDRCNSSSTPPIPQQPPMYVQFHQAAPISGPMPPFASGPPHPLHPRHVGANPFDNGPIYGERQNPKRRRIGPHGQFRPGSSSQAQAQSDQWPSQSMPHPNWSQQPPSNHPSAPIIRPSYPRQAHPNAFHGQQGQPLLQPPIHPGRRKRPYDQR